GLPGLETADLLVGLEVPEADDVILAGGQHRLAVGRERHIVNRGPVAPAQGSQPGEGARGQPVAVPIGAGRRTRLALRAPPPTAAAEGWPRPAIPAQATTSPSPRRARRPGRDTVPTVSDCSMTILQRISTGHPTNQRALAPGLIYFLWNSPHAHPDDSPASPD